MQIYLTPKTIAQQTDVSLASVYRWLKAGLQSYKVGSCYRITPAALEAFLERCNQKETVQVAVAEVAQ